MALEILGVLVTPLNDMGKCLFGALKRQINYFTSYNANIEKLRSQVVLLSQKQADVQISVEEAERRLDVPFEEVKNWQQNTERTIKEDIITFEEEVNANKSCLKGLCPNLIFRLKLSKKAVRMSEAVNSLLQQQGNFPIDSIAHPRPPASVELVRTSSIVENLSSRHKVMEDVMEALCNDSIRSIAVHGMGGIGKTTLVDKINNVLQGRQQFKKVIKVVVSKEPSLNIIQDIIAARLGMNLSEGPLTSVRANRLFERLKAEDSILIILDDLWETLDVAAIGIPSGSEHIGCKIMLTTRNFSICKQMKIQKIIKLEPLFEDESWALFKRKAGDVVRLSNIEPIAQEIVRRCKGSPLAIATLGSTLTSVEEVYVWKDALEVLKNPNRSGLQGIMPEVVESISFSYNRLHCREIKMCFMFCCLFPEDYYIDLLELRDYGVGEGFLNVNAALEVASNQLLSFVKKLKDCGLLLEGDETDAEVKMHDVVRDVAIAIASDAENGFLVNIGRPLRSLQDTEKLEGYKRMSFIENNNPVLPDPPPECPQLRSLLIIGSASVPGSASVSGSASVPGSASVSGSTSVSNEESCFEGMKALVVLNVSTDYFSFSVRLRYSTLPSFQCLSNLRTLYLVGCDLSNKVSSIGGLRRLEILRLCGSKIGRLPEEIGNLTNLMCLDLTDAELLTVAPNVISRLSNLEELYMLNGYNHWGLEPWDRLGRVDEPWEVVERSDEPNASFAEVVSLNQLSILRIQITDETPHEMQFHWWNNLKEFHVNMTRAGAPSIPSVHDFSYPEGPSLSYDSSSTYSILAIEHVNAHKHWFNKLLCIPKVRDLTLKSCFGGRFFFADLVAMGGGLKHLKNLRVTSCHTLKYLIRTEESNMDSLGELKRLWLSDLPLREIFRGPAPSITFFAQLRILDIAFFGKIKKVFSSNLLLHAKRLQNLEDFSVFSCDELEEVFNTGEEELFRSPETTPPSMNMMQLSSPRLKLRLRGLPKLTSIWKGVVPIGSLQHLKLVTLESCDSLEYLSSYSSAVALESVEDISIQKCNGMKKLIGSNREKGGATSSYSYSSKFTISPPPPAFPNLQSLHIYSCGNLKSLFSFTMALNLQQLRELKVGRCQNLEEIIAKEEEEEEEAEHVYFLPRLQSLHLRELSTLRSIIQGNLPISCPLKTIEVVECPNLKKLPLEPQIASSLESFGGSTEWFEGLEWEDESLRSLFQEKFKIYGNCELGILDEGQVIKCFPLQRQIIS